MITEYGLTSLPEWKFIPKKMSRPYFHRGGEYAMNGTTFLYISEIPRKDQINADPGLSVYYIDEDKEKLVFQEKYPLHAITNVSCIDAERRLLYVTSEEPDAQQKRKTGDRILVLELDKDSGGITGILDCKPTLSPNPVYVSLDQSKEHLLVANHTTHNTVYKLERDENGEWHSRAEYDDATVLLYSLNADGSIHRLEDVAKQEGNGPLRTQTHAHPHSVVMSPSGKLFAVPDKGADKVFMYAIEDDRFRLLAEPYFAQPGDEPRFCAFHPTKNYLYVNHEGNLGLDVLRYCENGTLEHVQTVWAQTENLETIPGRIYEHQGIAMHPSGNWLYSVARGVDAMAVFEIDSGTGMLTLIQLMQMDGDWPRCCQLTPDGKWLLAGTRNDGALILYQIKADGKLEEVGRVKHSCGVAYVSALQSIPQPKQELMLN